MRHQRISQDGLSSCRCLTTSHGDQKTMKKKASLMLDSFLFLRKDLEQDNGHFSVLVQRKSGILSVQTVHKVNGTEWRESGHPVFRATSPLSRGHLKSKGHGKLSIHYCADGETIETVFRTVISVNQLSLYGAVAEMCEEYETFQDRTEQPGS